MHTICLFCGVLVSLWLEVVNDLTPRNLSVPYKMSQQQEYISRLCRHSHVIRIEMKDEIAVSKIDALHFVDSHHGEDLRDAELQ